MKIKSEILLVGELQSELLFRLQSLGLRVCSPNNHVGPIACALFVGFDPSDNRYQFRQLVPRLGRRAKVIVVAPAAQMTEVMLALSDARLEPKLLRILSSSEPWIAVQAVVAKRGGLVIESVAPTDQGPASV